MTSVKPPQQPSLAERRLTRQAEALRDNLKRRKLKARELAKDLQPEIERIPEAGDSH